MNFRPCNAKARAVCEKVDLFDCSDDRRCCLTRCGGFELAVSERRRQAISQIDANISSDIALPVASQLIEEASIGLRFCYEFLPVKALRRMQAGLCILVGVRVDRLEHWAEIRFFLTVLMAVLICAVHPHGETQSEAVAKASIRLDIIGAFAAKQTPGNRDRHTTTPFELAAQCKAGEVKLPVHRDVFRDIELRLSCKISHTLRTCRRRSQVCRPLALRRGERTFLDSSAISQHAGIDCFTLNRDVSQLIATSWRTLGRTKRGARLNAHILRFEVWHEHHFFNLNFSAIDQLFLQGHVVHRRQAVCFGLTYFRPSRGVSEILPQLSNVRIDFCLLFSSKIA